MGELFEMIKDFPSLEQQIIEVCFLISNDKNSILKFKALSPKNQASRLLYKILSNEKVKKKDQKIELKEI